MIIATLPLGMLFLFVAVPTNAQFGEIAKSLGLDREEELSDDTVVQVSKRHYRSEPGTLSTSRESWMGIFLMKRSRS